MEYYIRHENLYQEREGNRSVSRNFILKEYMKKGFAMNDGSLKRLGGETIAINPHIK